MKKFSVLFIAVFVLSGCAGFDAWSGGGSAAADPSLWKPVVKDVNSDVCAQFEKSFVKNVIGKAIVETESGKNNCLYYTEKGGGEADRFITVTLYDRNYSGQEQGLNNLGFLVETDARIPSQHMIAKVEEEKIWSLYIKVSDDRFISMNTTNGSVSDDVLLNLAGAVSASLI